MKYFNEPTTSGRIVVSDQELYEKALRNYKAYCSRHGYVYLQPSPRLTEFDTSDNCKVKVTLHNNLTCRDSVENPKICIYSTVIKVSDDPESSYSFYELGIN